VAYNFAKLLTDKGHEVTVFTLRQPEQKSGTGESFPFQVKYYSPVIRSGLGAWEPRFFGALDRFDITHLHYPFYGTNELLWLKKKLRKNSFKLAIHYHMDVAHQSRIKQWLGTPSAVVRNSLFRSADMVTCASLDYIATSAIAKIYDRQPDKFRCVPFGVDSRQFAPGQSRSAGQKPTVLFVGGLDQAHYFKGLDVLFRAVRPIIDRLEKLIVVGDGDLRPYYQKQCQQLAIEHKVEFAGGIPAPELASFYQRADLLVLPSINRNEAFGLVLLEAMASGLPVIATNLPGVRSVFKHGQQGLIARPADPADLKAKLLKLIDNPEFRSRLGKQGRDLAAKHYSWQTVAEQLDRALKDCCKD